jgi:hypothetical protein
MAQSRIRVERIPADELTDHQIERLVQFGQREADLIDEMEVAARLGDRNLVWQIAEALVQLQDLRNSTLAQPRAETKP